MLGHTAFIFSLLVLEQNVFASGGDDKTLKIWQDGVVK